MIWLLLPVCLASGDLFAPAAGDFLDQALYYPAAFDRADSCYRAGDPEAAAGFYLEGLRTQPRDHVGVYNLACCYGLMGRGDPAFTALEDSLEAAALREVSLRGSELLLEVPGPFRAGLRSPNRFAGIAAFSGWFPEEISDMEIEAARSLPVRVVHGELDGAVPMQQSLHSVALLASHGLDVRLQTFQGGHVFHMEKFREILSEFIGTAPEGGVL